MRCSFIRCSFIRCSFIRCSFICCLQDAVPLCRRSMV
ncbi:hypothetical protein JF545_18230 [Halomonas litopenaei]|nr:hypothetical protein [Halomonas litopenaei]